MFKFKKYILLTLILLLTLSLLEVYAKNEKLVELGIVSEQYMANPEKKLTRSDLVSFILNALKIECAGESQQIFDDVDHSYWAFNCINKAYELGFICGHGDNTFRPDEYVTYEEAIKMIVSMVGYSPAAEAFGGYPVGFIQIAHQRNFLQDVDVQSFSDVAIKDDILAILNTSLEIPLLMLVAEYDDSMDYGNVENENGEYKTIMTEYHQSIGN